MYRLTARMEQHFRQSMADYHRLFDGGRCQGWELEELLVKAIKADTSANHLPRWQAAGHDDKADVLIVTNGREHHVQIKSGQIKGMSTGEPWLSLSGHRLGRFGGDLVAISAYLNDRNAAIISVPYRQRDDANGRQHIYRLCYLPAPLMQGIDPAAWTRQGKQFITRNQHNVEFSLRPSMSWQIWWKIPLAAIDTYEEFADGHFI